jgi:succinyl-diaminopimelate desuccinylase
MDQEQLIKTAKQLIAIPSTADNPAALMEACELIAQRIQASGKDITIEWFEQEGKPSLLAYRGNKRPDQFRIILNGHLDVIPGKPEQYEPYVQDGKLYGRGAYDMKTAAVVLTELFCDLVDHVPYALGLQIVSDEEHSGTHGTRYQIEQGVRADFVICGECGRSTRVYEIANEAKGVVLVTVAFTGSSSHGAYPWKGENAALKAAHFATKLHDRYPTPSDTTPQTTVTLTSIVTTNDAHNKVPEYATATLDARYRAGDANFATKQDFEALIAEIDPDARVINYEGFSGPLHTPPNSPLLLALKAAAERVESQPFVLSTRNATSDGRHYSDVGGAACEFGIAGENQHGDDEYVPLQAISNYYQTMRDFLLASSNIEWAAEHPTTIDQTASV